MRRKTKKTLKMLTVVLLIVLLQSMGYTYAKYISQEKGTGQAEVAKWAFEISKEGQQTKNVKLINTTAKDTMINGKIAPGTSGIMKITLNGSDSEVDIDYTLKFANEQNKPNNITFTYEGQQYKSLSEIMTIKGTIKHDSDIKTKDIALYWEWSYETGATSNEIAENDLLDTQDANAITEYTFDIIATGTQSK